MPTTCKKFIFITAPDIYSHEQPTGDSIDTILGSYIQLAKYQTQGKKGQQTAIPYLNVIEIPDDFFDFILNHISATEGIVKLAKCLIYRPSIEAKILCVPRLEAEGYAHMYRESLATLLNKLTQNIGEVSRQLSLVDNFTKTFFPEEKP